MPPEADSWGRLMGLIEAGAIHRYWSAQMVQRVGDAAWRRFPAAHREDAREGCGCGARRSAELAIRGLVLLPARSSARHFQSFRERYGAVFSRSKQMPDELRREGFASFG